MQRYILLFFLFLLLSFDGFGQRRRVIEFDGDTTTLARPLMVGIGSRDDRVYLVRDSVGTREFVLVDTEVGYLDSGLVFWDDVLGKFVVDSLSGRLKLGELKDVELDGEKDRDILMFNGVDWFNFDLGDTLDKFVLHEYLSDTLDLFPTHEYLRDTLDLFPTHQYLSDTLNLFVLHSYLSDTLDLFPTHVYLRDTLDSFVLHSYLGDTLDLFVRKSYLLGTDNGLQGGGDLSVGRTIGIADSGVTTGKIKNLAVTTGKLANKGVTYGKIQDVVGDRLLGRVGSSGTVQELDKRAIQGLINVEDGSQRNVQSDWDAVSGDAFIKNKPTKLSDFSVDIALPDLTDASISSLSAGQFLRYSGSKWENKSLAAGDIPNLNTSKITSGTLPVSRGGTGAVGYSAGYFKYNTSQTKFETVSNIPYSDISGTPTIGNGKLTLAPGTGLGLSATPEFTANQIGDKTITISAASGYAIPTSTQISNWNTTHEWGDHDGLYVTTNTNQTTGLTGNKTWEGNHTFDGNLTSKVLRLPTTTATTGIIYMNGQKYIHSEGSINNFFAGYQAGIFSTGNYNTASGFQALYNNTTGGYNTASGGRALYSNTTGGYNTASGFQALYNNTTGNYNTASGGRALYSNTTGGYNTASGYRTLNDNTTGNYNTASGFQALYSNTTGNFNTASGFQAGRYTDSGNLETSNQSVFLGVNTKAKSDNSTNEIVIGYSAVGNGSNTVTIGNNSITDNYFSGGIYATGLKTGTGKFLIADGNGLIQRSQIDYDTDIINKPDLSAVLGFTVVSNYASLPPSGSSSTTYLTSDNGKMYKWVNGEYLEVSSTASWGNITGNIVNQGDLYSTFEKAFAKNDAFNKSFGTVQGTVAEGNHTHATLTRGTGLTGSNYDGSGATTWSVDFGTTTGKVAQGDDSRIVNGATAFGWGNHANEGYLKSADLTGYATQTWVGNQNYLKKGDLSGLTATKPGLHFSAVDAVNSSSNAWNREGNSSLRLVNDNNLLAFFVGNVRNDREMFIQAGHYDPDYASVTGKLHLNPFGGLVYANGYVVNHGGNLRTSLGSSTTYAMTQKAVTDAILWTKETGFIHRADDNVVIGSSSQMSSGYKLQVDSGSDPGDGLYVRGSGFFTDDVTFFSDRRLKSDIVPIGGALGKIKEIQGYSYIMNGKKTYGHIAQEIKDVLPDAIGESDGYLTLNKDAIVPLHTEAIKELERQLTDANERNSKLEERISKLERKLDEILKKL